jgi:hypothetical protein
MAENHGEKFKECTKRDVNYQPIKLIYKDKCELIYCSLKELSDCHNVVLA